MLLAHLGLCHILCVAAQHNISTTASHVGGRPVKYDYTYQDRRITTGLYYQGKDNGVKATLGYNYRQADGWDHVKNARISASADLESYIADVQKEWKLGERDTLITGYSFKREDYTSLVKSSNKVAPHEQCVVFVVGSCV